MSPRPNIDAAEIAKFDELATRWWDPEGPFKPLHQINPLRLEYVESRVTLANKTVIDVGCGGGLFAEAMAARGARVIAVDMAASAISVARLHLIESGLEVDYRHTTAEALSEEACGTADIVTCMELLEHVPDPVSLVAACARLARPGGFVFFSTINRNPKSYLYAVIGAEHLLKLIPAGTHDYARFIRPCELGAWMRAAGLELRELTGMSYNPLTARFALTPDVSVNYLAFAQRPGP
jgi:2-polyprenyl-6-hydroxyphenyl methylase/3-demethylubiquinone-9 3-methyltransferase